MKRQLLIAALFVPYCVSAQTFDFDMTVPQPVYSEEIGYGVDMTSTPETSSKTKIGKPFYFSVKVPDGNYKVTVELGSKKQAGNTVVRAENRRLFVENANTAKVKIFFIKCNF